MVIEIQKIIKSAYLPFVIIPLCLSLIGWHHFLSMQELENLEDQMESLIIKSRTYLKNHENQKELLEIVGQADSNDWKENLEEMSFLKEHLRHLEKLSSFLPQDKKLKKRLHFLKDGENTIKLTVQNEIKKGSIVQKELSLAHPIEMNQNDLKQLITLVEDPCFEEGRPQIIFKNLELKKTKEGTDDEYFLVDFTLLIREKL